jgi:hypothetical protein
MAGARPIVPPPAIPVLARRTRRTDQTPSPPGAPAPLETETTMKRETAFRTALGVVLAGLASAIAPPAVALTSHDTSAGGACHPASGSLGGSFNRNLHYLTNIGGTDAYVVCHLQMDDDTQAQPPIWLVVHVAGQPGTQVTCTFQAGAFYDGANRVVASTSETLGFTQAATYGRLDFDVEPLVRPNYHTLLTLNCKVPAGGRLGLIERWE